MKKLHVAQDAFGFWELSFEDTMGSLTLLAHQFGGPVAFHPLCDAHQPDDARTAEIDVLTFGAKDHDATDGSAEFDAEVPLLN